MYCCVAGENSTERPRENKLIKKRKSVIYLCGDEGAGRAGSAGRAPTYTTEDQSVQVRAVS